MKKLFALLMTAVLIFSFAGCCDCTQTGKSDTDVKQTENVSSGEPSGEEKPMNGVFRYANWGDSMKDVEDAEPFPCVGKNETGFTYEVKLLTYNAEVFYIFDDNGFMMGTYKIFNSHVNDFNKFKKLLTEKYGEPCADGEDLSEMFKDADESAIWENENVEIELYYFETSGNIIILYTNPNEEMAVDTDGL